ncbi:MAG: substrate-binding domain-containing protein [Candidatus Aenigmarchaeota archaeon]|nr:substrate-binding domain-containing protein [Candidatus Aenigmarchaeota archaeon]
MKMLVKFPLIMGIFVLVLASGCIQETDVTEKISDDDRIVIGLSMASFRVERWTSDRDLFIERANELGAEVNIMSADDDADLQNRQAENMILQGVDVLVVVAHDGEKASYIIDKAHEAGIKVIAYDRLIKDCNLDYYISFDNVKVGEQQAQEVVNVVSKGNFAYIGGSPTDNNAFLLKEGSFNVLQPLIDSGDINIVLDNFTKGWLPELAYETMKNYLNENGGRIDAVIAANDGTASGIILALNEFGLAGTVPVSGQDASLAACQSIVEGTQTVTVYKPIKDIAYKAAEMAVAAANGEIINTNNVVNNGQEDVPSYLLDVVAVTKDNIIDTVIEDGFQNYENVYQNIPEDQRPPAV